MNEKGISVSRKEDFSQWFIDVCTKATLLIISNSVYLSKTNNFHN